MRFGKVTDEIVKELAAIVGAGHVWTTLEKRTACSRDEATALMKGGIYIPDVVVAPQNAREVSEILKLANRELIPVTPRGAGTGLSGGALPMYDGIVITDERMNHILEIDTENLAAVVEPGVITGDINVAAAKYELVYRGYPMSVLQCHIGGNIAENAGGGAVVKYGATMRHVLGIEVVLPTGEILTLGGKLMKDVSGYNLKEIFIGSEGTLGFVTKITVRLMPMVKHSEVLFALFPDTERAIRAVPRMMAHGGIIPSAVEYIDKYCYHKVCDFLNEELPMDGVEAVLLIEVEGSDEESVSRDVERAGAILKEEGAFEIYVADTRTTRERIWAVRQNIDEALRVTDPIQEDEDISVPISEIPEVSRELDKIEKKYNIRIANFAHAGDGNLHPTILKPANMSDDEWERAVEAMEWEIYAVTQKAGGVISGEHGIGSKRKKYFNKICPPENLALMKKIKNMLDPNGIMNPGKIFD